MFGGNGEPGKRLLASGDDEAREFATYGRLPGRDVKQLGVSTRSRRMRGRRPREPSALGQEQTDQYGDNGDDDQQLDQGESPTGPDGNARLHVLPPEVTPLARRIRCHSRGV